MRYGVVFMAMAMLFLLAGRGNSQQPEHLRYELVAHSMGPSLYRLDRETGEVCAIRVFDMKFAYKDTVKPCAP